MSKRTIGPRLVSWTDENGDMRIDGERTYEAPRDEGRKNAICYHVGPMPNALLESWMSDGDSAHSDRAGKARSYTYKSLGRSGTFRIMGGDTWSLPPDPDEAKIVLNQTDEALKAEGWEWGATAATIAGRILDAHGRKIGQLPPRWRAIAHEAIYQGPVSVLRGGSGCAVAVDRVAAFLHGLRAPVPVAWSPGIPKWTHARRCDGFVFATVNVDSCDLPPLPLRRGGGTLLPVGRIAGAWKIDLLRDAEESGIVTVEDVHEVAIGAETDRLYERCADRIESITDKRLRKLAYTRFWGRLARLGGWTGVKGFDANRSQWIGSSLWWEWSGHGGDSRKCPPDYRPDHAAYIAGTNALVMNQSARLVPSGSLCAAHVDCLWYDYGREPKNLPGEWKIKEVGPARFYAPGVYAHGSKLAASGRTPAPKTEEEVAEWSSKGSGATWASRAREWDGDSCLVSADATSKPLVIYDDSGSRIRYGINDGNWTPKGWKFKSDEESNHE